ncbi:transcriptional regulator GlxA family with amidase domain [Mucilaginibacter frigoritolerans]|jgi:transcriptional regulator GlxA family with amidase domain|uniref:Transcriptional regulator GlxA family with amidase domain n=1 Tax=Mucilaginibacter frigoritolerans TaxID=652788 RepID=A0A562TT00_9SPHI|nr:helix-turn-helix domain-containing protein [Mucilaginibacter frigoritolerans]TWI95910.1 transcriptional regulator GlxA family with amidase domain [Mucilaginibacter frigoritolerans]
MKHVSILVPNSPCILSSVIGAFKVFNTVNSTLKRQNKEPFFKIQLVGLSNETSLYEGLFIVRPEALISEVHQTDLIVIPAFSGDIESCLQLNQAYIPWIKEMFNRGAEIASLCTGAFLLASTGLLNGRSCSTHWMAADAFRQAFPDVKLQHEKIIIDEMGIYSSGGAYSFLNLMIYLVEKFCGREMAVYCSKMLEIEIERKSQSPFAIFIGQKDHEDESIKKAQLFMENNVNNKISVDQLSEMFAISRRNFERRFKKATSNTPVEYLQRVKIEAAKKSLESSRENINEVMYSVGYSDSKAFRTIFKKITGLSPVNYRNKYNREMTGIM